MIVDSPAAFLQAARALGLTAPPVAKSAFLIAPTDFALEPQSAADNRYMDLAVGVDPERAAAQHAALVETLQRLGIPVIVLPGLPDQKDGVFPNNVFATANGRFIVGAMRHEARRREAARTDVRELFTGVLGYGLVDLSRERCVAELTGPLVIDRARCIGLCGMSERVDDAGCTAMHEAFGLALTFRFDLASGEYHANVVLAVLAGRACVLHPGSFAAAEVPEAIARFYRESCGSDAAVVLADDEKRAFAANCIALTERHLFLSATARRALSDAHACQLERLGFELHSVEIDELEKAGGSLRCLIAEVY